MTNIINGMRSFNRAIRKLNEWIGKIFCFLILGLAILIPYEVIVRYVFNRPTMWSMEMNQFLFCIIVAMSGGYILSQGGHVNVDVLYSRFNLRTKAIVSLFTSLLIFCFLFFLLRENADAAINAVAWKESSASGWNPPIYPVKIFIPIGIFFMFLQSIARFLGYLIQAITGNEEMKDGHSFSFGREE
jgi:TRAP-type mannitol/chloroaromatic compound transport system permease small subunit